MGTQTKDTRLSLAQESKQQRKIRIDSRRAAMQATAARFAAQDKALGNIFDKGGK